MGTKLSYLLTFTLNIATILVVSKIDIDQLRKEIRGMQRWHVLYGALKQELGALGFWRNKPRGNPSLGGKTSVANRKKRESTQ